MRIKIVLLFIILLFPRAVYPWTTTNHWTPATIGNWNLWNSAGTATSNITLSPAQPDGYNTTLRITTPAGTSSNSGLQIAGATSTFSSNGTENEMWSQHYLYYPSDYTFHPIAEKISKWNWSTLEGNMQLVWEYGQLAMYPSSPLSSGRGWFPNASYSPIRQKNHWYKIIERVVINTPGQSNGVYQLWVDGKMVMNHSNIPYRSVGITTAWRYFALHLVWGGQLGNITLTSDMHQYRGTVILSNEAMSIPPPTESGNSLLAGATASNYWTPAGWTIKRVQGFESGSLGTGEWANGTVGAYASKHTGSYSFRGDLHWRDGTMARWGLRQDQVGPATDFYLSWWEYKEPQGRHHDEMIMARVVLYQSQDPKSAWKHNITFDPQNSGSLPDGGWNSLYGMLAYFSEGAPMLQKATHSVLMGFGEWVQWEFWFHPNTPTPPNAPPCTQESCPPGDGFIKLYKNGVLIDEVLNRNFVDHWDYRTGNVQVEIGGVISKFTWHAVNVPSPETTCKTGRYGASDGGGDDDMKCNWPIDNTLARVRDFNAPPGSCPGCKCPNQCPPDGYARSYYRFFDDIIVMTKTSSGDSQSPFVEESTIHPARNAANVAVTHRDISFNVRDSQGTVVQDNIIVTVEGSSNKTCTNGLTCTQVSTSNYAVRYTNGSDWSAGQEVNITLQADDNNANRLNEAWHFHVAGAPVDNVSITTASPLSSGTRGVAYSATLAATGGTTPYSWSVGTPPSTPPGAPYSGSSTFTGVTWDFANQIVTGIGSDIWSNTWGKDNAVWTGWGDGGGFSGSETACRTRRGIGKMIGIPPSLSYIHVTGCKANGAGCTSAYSHDPACDTTYANTLTGLPVNLLDIDGTLYQITYDNTNSNRIHVSTDNSATWTSILSFTGGTGTLRPIAFLQFGSGYSGARDSNVYVYFLKVGYTDNLYLARVPKTSIDNSSAWEYYTSSNPTSPTWGSSANAKQVFRDASNSDMGAHVIYLPIKGKYLLTMMGSKSNKLAQYDAPEPWGPWTTISYSTSWISPVEGTLGAYPSTKWLSNSDTTFWMTYSYSNTGDKLSIVKGTFTLASGSLPPGLTLSSTSSPPWDGIISGIPTTAGTYTFTVRATDAISRSGTKTFTLTIKEPPVYDNTVVIPYTAFQDTYINSSTSGKNTNYSSSTEFRTYQWDDYTVANRGIDNIAFISYLPANAVVKSATLKYYLYGWDGNGGTNPMRIYISRISGLTQPISSVTWSNFNGTLQQAEGYTDVDLVAGYKEFDVTNSVQWALANSSNLIIALDGGSQGVANTNRIFASADHPTIAWKPELVITYQIGVPTISSPGKLKVIGINGTMR